MSRIGKKPIAIPENVTVDIQGNVIQVKGPKGMLDWAWPPSVSVSMNSGFLTVSRAGDTKMERAQHGLARSIIHNMVTGVSTGYKTILDISGIGYKAQVSSDKILLSLGYSHPIEFHLPPGIAASVDQKQVQITLTGVDKQKIGQVAASLHALRRPDAYKGKGVRYAGRRLKLKVGKAGKK